MQNLPLLSDPEFIPDIHRAIFSPQKWHNPGLKAVVRFAWSLTLRALSQYPSVPGWYNLSLSFLQVSVKLWKWITMGFLLLLINWPTQFFSAVYLGKTLLRTNEIPITNVCIYARINDKPQVLGTCWVGLLHNTLCSQHP